MAAPPSPRNRVRRDRVGDDGPGPGTTTDPGTATGPVTTTTRSLAFDEFRKWGCMQFTVTADDGTDDATEPVSPGTSSNMCQGIGDISAMCVCTTECGIY